MKAKYSRLYNGPHLDVLISTNPENQSRYLLKLLPNNLDGLVLSEALIDFHLKEYQTEDGARKRARKIIAMQEKL